MMGFIKNELEKNKYDYILLENIVLYVKSLDEDNPSLSDTAKFLLRHYSPDGLQFTNNIDNRVYKLDITNKFIEIDENRPFFYFLKFVATYDDFESGFDDASSWSQYNKYFNWVFLPIKEVKDFIKYDCNLGDADNLQAFLQFIEMDKIKSERFKLPEDDYQLTATSTENFQNEIASLKSEINKLRQNLHQQREQQPNNEEWELIQRHRQRAPEFEALIQTLIHHSKEYDSNKQPLKREVAETFKEKTNMTANTRRADEVARILGLTEENNQ